MCHNGLNHNASAVDSENQKRQIASKPYTRNRAFRGRQTDEECH